MADPADLLALRALVDRYAIAIDRRDRETLESLFVPDGGIDVHVAGRDEPVARLRGADGLRALVEGVSVYADTLHLVANVAATVDGDTATAVTYCVAHHLVTDADEPYDERLLVVYDDRFVHTADGWRFDVRVIHRRWTERIPGAGQAPLLIDRVMAARAREAREGNGG
jgi:hypothetical protein